MRSPMQRKYAAKAAHGGAASRGRCLPCPIAQGSTEEILKYDKGAIVLVFLLTCFSVGMGIVEYSINYFSQYGVIYY